MDETILYVLVGIFLVMVIGLPISYELRLGRYSARIEKEREKWEVERQKYIGELVDKQDRDKYTMETMNQHLLLNQLKEKTIVEPNVTPGMENMPDGTY
jgi:hypothetical protein